MSEYLSIQQVAQRLGVSVDTVRQWEREGRLKAERTEGGHRRFLAADVGRLLAKRGAPSQPHGPASQPPGANAPGERPDGLPRMVSGPWQDEVREARARVEVLKARSEARELVAARNVELARSAKDAEEVQRREERRRHLEALKEFGRSLGQSSLPPEWRAQLTADLEQFVTLERFPLTLPAPEARAFVRARVEAVVQQHHTHLEEARAKEQQERHRALQRTQVEALIEHGKQHARWNTMLWDAVDQARVRHEVADRLREEVCSDWTEGEVEALVDETLKEWQEDEEADGAGDEEDDEDDDDEWRDEDDS